MSTPATKTVSETLSDWAVEGFRAAFGDALTDTSMVGVVPAANPQFGDYQCNAAMPLAKQLKKPPREVAAAFAAKAPPHPAVERMEIAGPGFINIHLNAGWIVERIQSMGASSNLDVPQAGAGRTAVMDYGSPNITKPLHIGHLRSHNIGSVLDRLHRFIGWRVIADFHLGDWGTQFGITIMGYRHFGDPKAMAERPLEELERVYVKSYEKGEQDPEWREQCRRELVKLQSGDADNLALWQEFVRLSIEELNRIYAVLGVKYDLWHGESYYRDRLAGVVDLLEKQGLAKPSEGATVVFLEEEKLPVCIVRKRDGGFNYATSDLATVAARVADHRPDKIVYVTDERQQLHFRQIFAICRRLGYTVQLDHVWFGLMRLPEGTFSTREGNVIRLDQLLDEAQARALKVVRETSPEMPPAQQERVARAVGIGAVKYVDLSTSPQSLITFTWEKALALDGNSGPYLQYAHARIASVQDKYAERFPGKSPDAFPIRFTDPIERTLALRMLRFPEVVVAAAQSYKPNVLTDYLYDLSQVYSTFYQNVPFLKADEGVRESRVRLCGLVARVLKTGLTLLGIEAPERI
jgi:arginyl-tRNA synthetase